MISLIKLRIFILLTSFCLTNQSFGQSQEFSKGMEEPKSILATIGDYRVKQLVSPGFSKLPLQRKLYVYYWIQAMEAGHDIAWMQMSQGGLEIKHLLEKVFKGIKLFNNSFAASPAG